MSKIKKILLKIFKPFILSENKIIRNEKLSAHFQFLTIKGKSLKKVQWVPGQKIKVQVSEGEARSYTPCSWNAETGEMQTLVYMHGKGPGALWARDTKPNQKVVVMGPKESLTLEEGISSIIFFGDETTFGLAHAFKKYTVNKKYYFLFESVDKTESFDVLKRLELEDSAIVSLEQAATLIHGRFIKDPQAQIVLAGKQQSIVVVRELLYANGIPKNSITKKVYWGHKDDPNGKLK